MRQSCQWEIEVGCGFGKSDAQKTKNLRHLVGDLFRTENIAVGQLKIAADGTFKLVLVGVGCLFESFDECDRSNWSLTNSWMGWKWCCGAQTNA